MEQTTERTGCVQANVVFENTALPDIIELRGVGQKYGNTTVIEDLNLLIEAPPAQGRFVVILGHSGCGKSSVLRYISGLQEPTSGQVLIKGKPRGTLPLTEDRVSMVFQQYSSLPWYTVLENVTLGLKFIGINKKDRDDRAREIIKFVGLEGHENKYAQYPTLSGGQLQRVAIARSLLANPEILLLDEPFGALDIMTRRNMQELLIKVWKNLKSTMIFVTHDVSEAVYLADEIWLMSSNPGRIVERLTIPLDPNRTTEIKRTAAFTDLVYMVEDRLLNLTKTTK